MKIPTLFILIIAATTILFGQGGDQISTITILGKESYIEKAEAFGIRILFEENPNRCDPEKGFVPLDQQVLHFKEAAKAKGLDLSNEEELSSDPLIRHPHKKVKYLMPTIESAMALDTLCRLQEILVEELFYKLPKHKYEKEDDKAVSALNDAVRKANFIAEKLGKKVVKVLNIDDDTALASIDNLMGEYDYDEEKGAEILELIQMLSEIDDPFATESKKPERNGAYSLLVTFEMQ